MAGAWEGAGLVAAQNGALHLSGQEQPPARSGAEGPTPFGSKSHLPGHGATVLGLTPGLTTPPSGGKGGGGAGPSSGWRVEQAAQGGPGREIGSGTSKSQDEHLSPARFSQVCACDYEHSHLFY